MAGAAARKAEADARAAEAAAEAAAARAAAKRAEAEASSNADGAAAAAGAGEGPAKRARRDERPEERVAPGRVLVERGDNDEVTVRCELLLTAPSLHYEVLLVYCVDSYIV